MPSCMPPAHVHFFKVMSSVDVDHNHLLRLYTFSVNGTAYDGHVHQYQGITGIKYGHYHNYFGTTGPAIPLQDGTHYHFLEGMVELNAFNTPRGRALQLSASMEGMIDEWHQHTYSGFSSLGLGYEPW